MKAKIAPMTDAELLNAIQSAALGTVFLDNWSPNAAVFLEHMDGWHVYTGRIATRFGLHPDGTLREGMPHRYATRTEAMNAFNAWATRIAAGEAVTVINKY